MLKVYLFRLLFLALFLYQLPVQAQQKKAVELEDLFASNYFNPTGVYGIDWMQKGKYYTAMSSDDQSDRQLIKKYDITTGEEIAVLFDNTKIQGWVSSQPFVFSDYHLGPDQDNILLANELESIYRRSTKAYYYLYNIKTKEIKQIHEGDKISYATFSPDGKKIAYVRQNNMYYTLVDDIKEIAITDNGKFNHIINGSTDWVYEEEFSFAKAFFWSPDSEKIAFYTFNESEVKEYNMQVWGPLYPEDYKFKYPKAGEKNSLVAIRIFDLEHQETLDLKISDDHDIYIPRVFWTNDPSMLAVIKLNRLQNHLQLYHTNADNGDLKLVLEEKSETYVDIDYNDEYIYLENGKGFVTTNEQSGYKHLYHYDLDGNLITQITHGNWEVDDFYGIDQKRKIAYFTSTEESPLERHLYTIKLNGKNKTQLSKKNGNISANFSPDFSYYIASFTAVDEPMLVTLHKAPSGKQIKVLEDNARLKQRLANHTMGKKSFFSFDTEDGTSLGAFMIKPHNFDPSKKYPVIMYVYGGPGSQVVLNNWGGQRDMYHHYLTQHDFIVVGVDNRGTGGRGKAFKHKTYAQLGKYETMDQLSGARYLAGLPYVDEDKIGIWGWSYGGYMSSLAIFDGAEELAAAIAVAPVTNWRFYDTIYTERYLKTPQLNPDGYDAWSPITHAYKLEDDYLLIHGTGDDNVHFQNAVELQNALIAANKQFDSFFYPNRAHGISGGITRYHLYSMMTNFWLEKLKNN